MFRLRYPYQEQLRNYGDFTAAAQASIYSMPAQEFYQLHPFHIVLDSSMQLLQWGRAVEQVVPDMQVGQHVSKYFKVRQHCWCWWGVVWLPRAAAGAPP